MPYTFIFALVALLIFLAVSGLVLVKKGWKASLLAGGVTFILLAAAFVISIVVIVSAMDGNPG